MRIFDYFDKIQLFNRLIECERTGPPGEFATRLDVSRSKLYEIIEELKSRDIDIAYSRTRQTFYYTKPVTLEIKFRVTYLDPLEIKKISGGSQIALFRSFFRTELP